MNTMEEQIKIVCTEVETMLLIKNQSYGGIETPVNIFSKANAMEQICVRIDDKLSRLTRNGDDFPTEDTELDLIGYLVLKKALCNLIKNQDDKGNKGVY